jgi:hypothetical protein
MKKVAELLQLSDTQGKFGVEVELEGDELHSAPSARGWRYESDGSLSEGGIEAVLRHPLDKEEAKQALGRLYTTIQEHANIRDRQRAGVHVHLNCQQYTLNQIFTTITAYLLLEDLLMEWCGDMRKGNHFCFSASDAETIIFALRSAVMNRNIYELQTDEIRYASLNVMSLFRYGSLEFRGMRTPNEPEPIMEWIDILDELTTNALKFSNPQDLIQAASGYEEERFLELLVPPFKKELTKLKSFKKGCLIESARLLQIFAYCSEWKEEATSSYTNPFAQNRESNRWG